MSSEWKLLCLGARRDDADVCDVCFSFSRPLSDDEVWFLHRVMKRAASRWPVISAVFDSVDQVRPRYGRWVPMKYLPSWGQENRMDFEFLFPNGRVTVGGPFAVKASLNAMRGYLPDDDAPVKVEHETVEAIAWRYIGEFDPAREGGE